MSDACAEQIASEMNQLDLTTGGAYIGTGLLDGPAASGWSTHPRTVSAEVGAVVVSGGSVDRATEIVKGMRAGFRRCYARAREDNPKLAGTITFVAKLGPNGEVVDVSPKGGSTLPATLIGCMGGRIGAAQFPVPTGTPSITIPVTLAPP